MSDPELYGDRLSTKYECGNCGGKLRVTGAAPIAKGSVTAYKCIRCSGTGGVKDKLRREPTLSGVVTEQ